MPRILFFIFLLLMGGPVSAQSSSELTEHWLCQKAALVTQSGEQLSASQTKLSGWLPATVPGTVLTTLLNNHRVPDPYIGTNNDSIPDIYNVGADYYTYWFVNDFKESYPAADEQVWLQLRGVNYSFDAWLNGHKLNTNTESGMFLRHEYEIGKYLNKNGKNRLAIIVHPPQPVGNPNGGQGGDGMIAHSVTNQFVAGWDWMQPVRDRNTGIWDKVEIVKTGMVRVANSHVVTHVKLANDRFDTNTGYVDLTTELSNASDAPVTGMVYCHTGWKLGDSQTLTLAPHTTQTVRFKQIEVKDASLWMPNGYGKPNLYGMTVGFQSHGQVSSSETFLYGIRELQPVWNAVTNSREMRVNVTPIFMKGGNWIMTDAMLRFSKARYDAELRMHRDMNLNLIRVWGGGITERPEFYEACDKYGILVMQDFWVSGDCNGRWYDPLKKEDTTTRRNYPDDHRLFITSAADQIKMLRNHPSLAIWCGGNEIRPPFDVLTALRDTLIPNLDGTRLFFEYSNHDSMSLNTHDGPYTIKTNEYFWQNRSFAFNSEIGSVGIGELASIKRSIPAPHLVPPAYDTAMHKWVADPVWNYHKYYSYDSSLEDYGHPVDVEDFARKAQLVNYEQYRSLTESFMAHQWDWYTGFIIWKTQNPWPAMVGQMYDHELDPNACLNGVQQGCKPEHAIYDPVGKKIIVPRGYEAEALIYDKNGSMMGRYRSVQDSTGRISPNPTKSFDIREAVENFAKSEGVFAVANLLKYDKFGGLYTADENTYWVRDLNGDYLWLQRMPASRAKVSAQSHEKGKAELTINNPEGAPLAFFNHLTLVDTVTGKQVLPAFFSNNYLTVLPGGEQKITVEYDPATPTKNLGIQIEGYNMKKRNVAMKEGR